MKKLITILVLCAVAWVVRAGIMTGPNVPASNITGSVTPIPGITNSGVIGSLQIDFFGDSITATNGNGGTPPSGTGTNTWSNFILTNAVFNTFGWSNYASAGAKMSDEVGSYSTTVHLDSNQPCVMCLLGGVNDVNAGGGSNQTIVNISNIWAQARADGKLVIAATIWPNFSWTDDKTNQINGINAWIRTHPQYYDALADTSNMVDADMLDHLHPTTAGALKLASIFSGAFQKLPLPAGVGTVAARSGYFNSLVSSNGATIYGTTGATVFGSGGAVCVGNNPTGKLGIYVFNNSVVGISDLWAGGWPIQFDINGHSQVLYLGNDGNSSFGGNLTINGTITVGTTNAAPSNTTTPKLWVPVIFGGQTYKMPLYQ